MLNDFLSMVYFLEEIEKKDFRERLVNDARLYGLDYIYLTVDAALLDDETIEYIKQRL